MRAVPKSCFLAGIKMGTFLQNLTRTRGGFRVWLLMTEASGIEQDEAGGGPSVQAMGASRHELQLESKLIREKRPFKSGFETIFSAICELTKWDC